MATQLTQGLWQIDCQTRDRPNVYLVGKDGDWTLVDAGWPGDERTVRDGLTEAGIRPETIDRVLLTHYDADHVGTLARLTPALDAPVYIHHAEAPYLTGERLPPWTARNGLETLHRLYYRRMTLPNLPIRPLQDGDQIGGFDAVHTPGHTPGHTVFYHEETDATFLGDLAFAIGESLRPSGRFSSYDRRQIPESIRRLLAQIPEFEYVCPGHGPSLTNGSYHLTHLVE
ncbi:MBL fold metallo-hydrolase [Halomicrococcus sp. SG-WS-1]|uniref:MBL fold metallo-hydrolase n=1 Tax=Halomicrococcus sp. SG-WS-1 TaxID=3439057 RepID=UPI003F7A27D7